MEGLREKALTLTCETCAAMPGQACRRTKDAYIHTQRRIEAAKALGLKLDARPERMRRVA